MILIIGAGGVSRVSTKKCAKNISSFKKIFLASRNIDKCNLIAKEIKEEFKIDINTYEVNADNIDDLVKLIEKTKVKIVLNLALPYQDISIMKACIKTKTHYVDTANYENPKEAKFSYKEQWALNEEFEKAGIMALLGSGFDPGVTNVFCAYANKNLFDKIEYIDILDCNDGNNGYAFATNFNPEINLREVSSKGKYWEEGKWIETKPMEIKIIHNYPQIGEKDSYLLYHEEMESLVKNIKGLKRIRFFMTFSKSYLEHMNCLNNVGLLRIDEVNYNGNKIIPLQFLKSLLPDPANLGEKTIGKTNIGCIFNGFKDGKEKKVYIYNVCDHQDSYKETKAQAVSYTTGVPAMIGAKLILEAKWLKKGVHNMEEFDPNVFMDELKNQGLPYEVKIL